jgi:Arc/MetJ family transcription regulator
LTETPIDAQNDAFIDAQRTATMRTTLTLDDDLLAQAQKISGLKERSQLLREALLALVQRESAKRLAQLGGSEPQLQSIPRQPSNT